MKVPKLTIPTDMPTPADHDPITTEYRAYQSLLGTADDTTANQDPFAAQRDSDNDPFAKTTSADGAGDAANGDGSDAVRVNSDSLSPPSSPPVDRRLSREWGT